MSKRKKTIIIISSVLIFFLGIGIVFGAYQFSKTATSSDITTGDITVNSKSFVNYSNTTGGSLRVDTIYSFPSISLNSTETYTKTNDKTFQQSKSYYVVGTYEIVTPSPTGTVPSSPKYYQDSNGGFSEVTAGSTFTSGTSYYSKTSDGGYTKTSSVTIGKEINGDYYEKSTTYTGIKNVGEIISLNDTTTDGVTTYKYTAKKSTDGKTASDAANANIIIITTTSDSKEYDTLTLSFDTAGIKSGTTTISGAEVVIGNDGTSLTVIDKSTDTNGELNKKGQTIKITDTNNAITCSATKNKLDNNCIYLNQLGLEFEFTNEIAVYVRIHIQDAWVLTRVYSSNKKQTYTLKDQTQGNSPFYVKDTTNWYYDASENTVYMKAMVKPEKTSNGEYKTNKYRFDVNQAYYYISTTKTSVYKEYVDVQVSFYVDIVQANRAYEKWGVDPSTLGQTSSTSTTTN